MECNTNFCRNWLKSIVNNFLKNNFKIILEWLIKLIWYFFLQNSNSFWGFQVISVLFLEVIKDVELQISQFFYKQDLHEMPLISKINS